MIKSNLFQRFMLPYLILILIIFTPQFYMFSRFTNSLEKSHRDKWMELSKRKGEQIDSKLEEIDNIMSQILLDPDFRYAAFSESENIGLLFEYTQSLPLYSQINESLLDVIIYFYENELFLTPGAFSLKPLSFFQSRINSDPSSYDRWLGEIRFGSGKDRFLAATQFPVDSFTATGEILTYIKDFPLSNRSPKGFVFSLISVKSLLDEIYVDFLEEELNFMIFSGTEKMASMNSIGLDNIEQISLINANDRIDIKGEKYHLYFDVSRFAGMRYVSLVPDSLQMKQINQLKKNSLLLFLFFLGLGGMLSVYFALRSVTPMRKIISLLDSQNEKQAVLDGAGSFEEIFHSIESLIDNNSSMQLNLKQHKDDLCNSFLSQLITGDMGNEDTLNNYLEYIGLPIQSEFYLMAIAKLSGFSMDAQEREVVEELEQKKLILKTVLEEIFPRHLLIQNLHSDKIILLFHYKDAKECDGIGSRLEEITKTLEKDLKVKSQFAVGPVFHKLIDSHISYRRILSIFNNPVPSEVSLFYLDSTPPSERLWTYDLETELQLISLIRMGDKDKAMEMLRQLREDNKGIGRKRNLVFLSELSGTIFKLAYQMLHGEELNSFESDLFEIRQSEHIIDYYKGLEERISFLCDISENRKESHNRELRDAVFRYVDEHFTDFDLNLYKVASEFNIAEKYLSRFFKDQAGSNFAGYIEDLRMKRAVLLMTDTTYPLSLISEKVGYSNNNTFYKAFKRKFAMSPGSYREKIRQK